MIDCYPPIEARVLAEMICTPAALALCDDVETSDFVDMHHVMVLHGIRHVQNAGKTMCVIAVLDAIEEIAIDWGSPEIAIKVDGNRLAMLIARAPKLDTVDDILADISQLRDARERRTQRIKDSYAAAGRKYQ